MLKRIQILLPTRSARSLRVNCGLLLECWIGRVATLRSVIELSYEFLIEISALRVHAELEHVMGGFGDYRLRSTEVDRVLADHGFLIGCTA